MVRTITRSKQGVHYNPTSPESLSVADEARLYTQQLHKPAVWRRQMYRNELARLSMPQSELARFIRGLQTDQPISDLTRSALYGLGECLVVTSKRQQSPPQMAMMCNELQEKLADIDQRYVASAALGGCIDQLPLIAKKTPDGVVRQEAWQLLDEVAGRPTGAGRFQRIFAGVTRSPVTKLAEPKFAANAYVRPATPPPPPSDSEEILSWVDSDDVPIRAQVLQSDLVLPRKAPLGDAVMQEAMSRIREQRPPSDPTYVELVRLLSSIESPLTKALNVGLLATAEETYVYTTTLGFGGFGKIRMAVGLSDGRKYAIKELLMSDKDGSKTTRSLTPHKEQELAKILGSPMEAHEVVELTTLAGTRKCLYVMDELGGDVLQLVDQQLVDPAMLRNIIAQCAHQLDVWRDKHLAHNDMKLSNIFFDKVGRFVVGDLGLAKRVEENDDVCGTPDFMPPEVLDMNRDFLSDIYTFGLSLFETFSEANTPFPEPSYQDTDGGVQPRKAAFDRYDAWLELLPRTSDGCVDWYAWARDPRYTDHTPLNDYFGPYMEDSPADATFVLDHMVQSKRENRLGPLEIRDHFAALPSAASDESIAHSVCFNASQSLTRQAQFLLLDTVCEVLQQGQQKA